MASKRNSWRQPRPSARAAALVALFVGGVAAAGCSGGDGAPAGPPLSADAERGRQVARTNGCAACHGTNGEGLVGPAFVGLFGSTVTFDDGSTAVADATYLRESIVAPSARRVGGYRLPMPESNLDDADIDALIDYIEALSEPVMP